MVGLFLYQTSAMLFSIKQSGYPFQLKSFQYFYNFISFTIPAFKHGQGGQEQSSHFIFKYFNST